MTALSQSFQEINQVAFESFDLNAQHFAVIREIMFIIAAMLLPPSTNCNPHDSLKNNIIQLNNLIGHFV